AHARLVLFNERYLQMYRLPPDVVKPGCTIRDLVENRIRSGTFFAIDPERYIADLTNALLHDRTPSTRTLELADGRIIAVSSQPMAGGGWVVTHEDVTERHRAVKELERTRNFLDTVLETVPPPTIAKHAKDLPSTLPNRPTETSSGAARDRFPGKTAADVFPVALAKDMEGRAPRLLASGDRHAFDARPIDMPG